MVKGLSPYTLVPPDAVYLVNPTVARNVLQDKVTEAAAAFPGSKALVFYFGEGASGSRVPAIPFDIDRDKVAGGAVLGYGTPEGAPIPAGWVDGKKGYQSDPSGNGKALNSAIDETRLKAIAGQLNVPYFHRESGQPVSGVLPPVDQNIAVRHDGAKLTTRLVERREMYWVFTLLAAGLLLQETALTIREYRRNRMSRRDVAHMMLRTVPRATLRNFGEGVVAKFPPELGSCAAVEEIVFLFRAGSRRDVVRRVQADCHQHCW
nr:hypothetical protein [Mycobacterium lepraemurium]